MATRLEDEFDPSRINAPNAAYPAGSLKDETTPGVSDDGTPLASRVGNDWQGFSQSALDKAGIAANGQPDSVSNPQILQAIEQMYNDGDSQLAGGNIWPLSSQNSASSSPPFNNVPSGTLFLRDASSNNLYSMNPTVSGLITAIDFSARTATIDGTAVTLDLSPSINCNSVSDMISKVDSAGVIGLRFVVDDYYGGSTPNNSGKLFFKVVASGTGTADGGKYIDAASFQLEQNLSRPYNVKAWGAIGNDVDIDTSYIKNCINFAKPKTATSGGGEVYFPDSSYVVDETILAPGGSNITSSGIRILGDVKGGTRIRKEGTSTGDGDVNAVFQLANSDQGSDSTVNNYNIEIGHFTLGGDCDYAIYDSGVSGAIYIHDCLVNGAIAGCSWGEIFQSRFIRLDLRGPTGFEMRESGTSNYLNSCFARLTTVAGYKLGGTYSSAENLGCDSAASGAAYLFNFGTWEIAGLGCESPDVQFVVNSLNSRVNISNMVVFPLDETNANLRVLRCQGGDLTVEGLRVQADNGGTPQVMAGSLQDNGPSSSIRMTGSVSINDTWPSNAGDYDVNSSGVAVTADPRMDSSLCFIRSGGQVGIGNNSASNKSKFLDTFHDTPYMRVPGIITNVTNFPETRIDGVNIEFQRGGRRGDTWLVDRPDEIRGLGWVLITENPTFVRDGTYRKIPYVDSGTTAERPTVRLVTGQQYFDTSLGANGLPIWYNGTSWQDAAGNAV